MEMPAPMPLITENRFLPSQKPVWKLRMLMEKKLQQIGILLEKRSNGQLLDNGQREKVARQGVYQRALEAIDKGASHEDVQQILEEKTCVSLADPSEGKKAVSVGNERLLRKETSKRIISSPNLLPVRIAVPRSREIGELPRFLEPSWKESHASAKKKHSQRKDLPPFPTLAEATYDGPVENSKWLTFELQSITNKEGTMSLKAIPSKDVEKMSLGDFLTTPAKPPQPKKSGPAWGSVQKTTTPSFESIQQEQRNHRPGMVTKGSKPVVERRRTVSHWQLHSDVQVQSIRSIQTEERAVKELSSMYQGWTVRVKTGTARGSLNETNNR